jgi:hypothetical protein
LYKGFEEQDDFIDALDVVSSKLRRTHTSFCSDPEFPEFPNGLKEELILDTTTGNLHKYSEFLDSKENLVPPRGYSFIDGRTWQELNSPSVPYGEKTRTFPTAKSLDPATGKFHQYSEYAEWQQPNHHQQIFDDNGMCYTYYNGFYYPNGHYELPSPPQPIPSPPIYYQIVQHQLS